MIQALRNSIYRLLPVQYRFSRICHKNRRKNAESRSGDINWMSKVFETHDIRYSGFDIAQELIAGNAPGKSAAPWRSADWTI